MWQWFLQGFFSRKVQFKLSYKRKSNLKLTSDTSGVALDCGGDGRTEPEGERFDLLVYLHSRSQKRWVVKKSQTQAAEMSFSWRVQSLRYGEEFEWQPYREHQQLCTYMVGFVHD